MQIAQFAEFSFLGAFLSDVALIVAFFVGRSDPLEALGGDLFVLFSPLCGCIPNTGSFLIDACLFTNFAMSFSRAVPPRLTIS